MDRLHRMFREHPASVGESYGQHLASAWSFGWRMLGASLACFAHGLLPFLFTKTGSRAIGELHERMIVNRHRQAPSASAGGEAHRAASAR